MSENTKKTQITIDDVEYAYEDLTQEQQHLFNHCLDLDRKIGSAKFQLDQLSVGKNAFITLLKEALAKKE
jgi:cell division septum initiation protein DivIVA